MWCSSFCIQDYVLWLGIGGQGVGSIKFCFVIHEFLEGSLFFDFSLVYVVDTIKFLHVTALNIMGNDNHGTVCFQEMFHDFVGGFHI